MSLRGVSRKLHFALSDPMFWKSIYITPSESKNVKYVKSVFKASISTVHTMSVIGYLPPSASDVSFLIRCNLLTHLDIFCSHFSDFALIKLVRSLPNLSRFAMGMPNKERSFGEILPLLSSLTQLILYFTLPYTRLESFAKFWEACSFKPCSVAIVKELSWDFNCSSLHSAQSPFQSVLSVYDCSPDSCTPNINLDVCSFVVPVSISGVVTNSMGLKVSKAVSSSILTGNHLYCLATTSDVALTHAASASLDSRTLCSNVTCLDLSKCKFSIDFLRSVLSQTPNLATFNIHLSTIEDTFDPLNSLDEVFGLLSIHCKNLISIFSFVKICHVSNPEMVWENISTLKYLEHLSICSCSFIPRSLDVEQSKPVLGKRKSRIPFLSGTTLTEKVKKLSPKFQSLFVYSCPDQERYSFQQILSVICNFINLKCLHITLLSEIVEHDIFLEELLTSCRKLEELTLKNYCMGKRMRVNVTEAMALSKIKHLTFTNVNLFSSFFKALVPDNGQNTCLQTLDLELKTLPAHAESYFSRLLYGCPNLFSCTICAMSTEESSGLRAACKEAKRVSQELGVPIFQVQCGHSVHFSRSYRMKTLVLSKYCSTCKNL